MNIKKFLYIFEYVFRIEILINFMSAFYDQDFILVDNLKKIANNYLRGWFILDLLTVIPFYRIEKSIVYCVISKSN